MKELTLIKYDNRMGKPEGTAAEDLLQAILSGEEVIKLDAFENDEGEAEEGTVYTIIIESTYNYES